MIKLFERKSIVVVDVLYYMPDYNEILQEFLWQTDDYWPGIPRVHKFLRYWRENIDAKINRVYVTESFGDWQKVDFYREIN